MKPIMIQPCRQLRGVVMMPGDKSVSHRAAICAALASGRTRIKNFLFSEDCRVTLGVLKNLGVGVAASERKGNVVIESPGSFRKPESVLWMGESGTSARVLLGLLAGQNFPTTINAAPSLLKRPMARVMAPLRLMGAQISGRKEGEKEFLPAHIFPAHLQGITWRQEVASAQVKSAILSAGLFAKGVTTVIEPVPTRDHTERMLEFFGARIRIRKNRIAVEQGVLKTPGEVLVPGDISSAAFFIVGALLAKNSKIRIKDAGVNPTRIGFIAVLRRMGGRIQTKNIRRFFEPMADYEVVSTRLKATVVKAKEIPALIDELPILMVAAARAKGKTVFEGVEELRVKETDRIRSMEINLKKLGVGIKIKSRKKTEDLEIVGVESFPGGISLESFSDHRTAMSMIVAGLVARGPCRMDDTACITKSFPGFQVAMQAIAL